MKKDDVKDVVSQVTGFLSAVLLFLGAINVKYDWFTSTSIDAFGYVLGAGIALAITLYTIWKNHFAFTRRARAQKETLKRLSKK